jgi:hypothetical protein
MEPTTRKVLHEILHMAQNFEGFRLIIRISGMGDVMAPRFLKIPKLRGSLRTHRKFL